MTDNVFPSQERRRPGYHIYLAIVSSGVRLLITVWTPDVAPWSLNGSPLKTIRHKGAVCRTNCGLLNSKLERNHHG